jgi:hypothetical protein
MEKQGDDGDVVVAGGGIKCLAIAVLSRVRDVLEDKFLVFFHALSDPNPQRLSSEIIYRILRYSSQSSFE